MRVIIALFSAVVLIVPSFTAADTLPRELSDEAFWKLVSDFSEEGGAFRFEYMSNEQEFQNVIPRLKENRKPGGVYLGVGPEQNFTYIAAVQPQMAFIFDIRRQNMIEHLIYKALFEMSSDRVDFLSRLFARKAPVGLGERPTAAALFQAFRNNVPDRNLYIRNLQSILDHLTKVHKFQLNAEDRTSVEYIYTVFVEASNAFSITGQYSGFGGATYADLMTATDEKGQMRSYLASDENFQIVRELHKKNLIVPLVADFAGTKALRNVAAYVKDHGSAVTAFYTSNVEQYLFQQGDDWRKFLTNVSAFPLNSSSMFIRSSHFAYGETPRSIRQANGRRFIQLLAPMAETTKAFGDGRISGYDDVIRMSR